MGTLITVAVILAMIAVGVLLIHLLNAQHDERIAAFRYSDLLPSRRSRTAKPRQQSNGLAGPTAGGAHPRGPRALRRILSARGRRA